MVYTTFWDGTVLTQRFDARELTLRNALFENAKAGNWREAFAILNLNKRLANVVQPDSVTFNTLLHWAAQNKVQTDIIEQLTDEFGGLRNIRNSNKQTAYDIAKSNGSAPLYLALEPINRYGELALFLNQVRSKFDELLYEQFEPYFRDEKLRYPQLNLLLELEYPSVRFAISRHGYEAKYWIKTDNNKISKLFLLIGNRFLQGSERTYEITSDGSKKLDK